ncbi:MAG TPA: NAD-dependent epimerase/dehydratase family protein, partial [Acidimicrobiia bacterium]|nr:NAD-dependent epimerase/dehydratase family protein [Acidimicrobiia bacterium]
MRVLVTGASGFIGAHVARMLLERGHEVHAVVRPGRATGGLADLEGSISIEEADLADGAAAGAVAEATRPDALVHAAWYVEA